MAKDIKPAAASADGKVKVEILHPTFIDAGRTKVKPGEKVLLSAEEAAHLIHLEKAKFAE